MFFENISQKGKSAAGCLAALAFFYACFGMAFILSNRKQPAALFPSPLLLFSIYLLIHINKYDFV